MIEKARINTNTARYLLLFDKNGSIENYWFLEVKVLNSYNHVLICWLNAENILTAYGEIVDIEHFITKLQIVNFCDYMSVAVDVCL